MNYIGIFVGLACAIFFYRAAEYERMSPWLWVVASVGLAILVALLTSGIGMVILAQFGLFLLMWGYNAYRSTPGSG